MLKKFLGGALLVSSIVAALPAMAQTTGKSAVKAPATDVVCLKSAIDKRDNAIMAAYDAFGSAMKLAVQTRRDALKAAWDMAVAKDRNKAIKAAWSAFDASSRKARKDFRTARNLAWSQFSTDRKACGLRGGENDRDDANRRGGDAE